LLPKLRLQDQRSPLIRQSDRYAGSHKSKGFWDPRTLSVTYVVDRNGLTWAKFMRDKRLCQNSLSDTVFPSITGQFAVRNQSQNSERGPSMSWSLHVRTLAFAAPLVAGGAPSGGLKPGAEPKISHFEAQSQAIDERENHCIRNAAMSSDRKSTSSDPNFADSGDPQKQLAMTERDRKLGACRAAAARERDELSVLERTNYENSVQQQRNLNSLMMIFTASTPR
jgi:hypothetical protein